MSVDQWFPYCDYKQIFLIIVFCVRFLYLKLDYHILVLQKKRKYEKTTLKVWVKQTISGIMLGGQCGVYKSSFILQNILFSIKSSKGDIFFQRALELFLSSKKLKTYLICNCQMFDSNFILNWVEIVKQLEVTKNLKNFAL